MTREAIRDAYNRVIGYYLHQPSGDVLVYDQHNRLMGRATSRGTFDAQNRRISPNKEPGLLLPR